MKKYPEEKIITILKEVEAGAGAKVAETCSKYGIRDATYYNSIFRPCANILLML